MEEGPPDGHNFLIKYTMKETGNALEGDEALELTTANYGRDELWLLLVRAVRHLPSE